VVDEIDDSYIYNNFHGQIYLVFLLFALNQSYQTIFIHYCTLQKYAWLSLLQITGCYWPRVNSVTKLDFFIESELYNIRTVKIDVYEGILSDTANFS